MFCKECGKEISDNSYVCPHCGVLTDNKNDTKGKKNSKVVALLLCFFVGMFGIHRFYLGHTGTAVTMLILTVLIIPAIVTAIWTLVDLVLILLDKLKFANGESLDW